MQKNPLKFDIEKEKFEKKRIFNVAWPRSTLRTIFFMILNRKTIKLDNVHISQFLFNRLIKNDFKYLDLPIGRIPQAFFSLYLNETLKAKESQVQTSSKSLGKFWDKRMEIYLEKNKTTFRIRNSHWMGPSMSDRVWYDTIPPLAKQLKNRFK